jgi:hypothetical protein
MMAVVIVVVMVVANSAQREGQRLHRLRCVVVVRCAECIRDARRKRPFVQRAERRERAPYARQDLRAQFGCARGPMREMIG